MTAILSRVARAGLALALALLTLAVARWPPVDARPPWDVRALPLFPLALSLGVLAAITGNRAGSAARRRLRPSRALALLAASSAALAAVVALRPAAGLPALVSSAEEPVATLPAGAVDVSGPRLRALPFVRRWTFRWDGPLQVERTGTYRLWMTGRGRVDVLIDGIPVLSGEGDALRAGADVPIGAGTHRLQVTLRRIGAGPRLRVGWTRPDGFHETLPVRLMGPPIGRAWWWITDALALLCAAAAFLVAWTVDWTRARPLPAPRPFTRHELAASLAGHAALVAVMSWPLVTDPVHLGVMDRPDGRLNAWILAWDAHALFSAMPPGQSPVGRTGGLPALRTFAPRPLPTMPPGQSPVGRTGGLPALRAFAPRPLPTMPPGQSPAGRTGGLPALRAFAPRPLPTMPPGQSPAGRTGGLPALRAFAPRPPTARLFQAPAFHPLPDVLAFSENLLLPAVLVAPLQRGGPVLAYNGALVLSMVFSGLGAQLLARRVSGGRLAAFVGGAIFAVGAHRWIRLAHLQSQVTVFLPLVLLAFEHFWSRRTLGRAARIGLALGLQALSSIYVAAVGALAAATATLCALVGGLRGREALKLPAGLLVALVVAAPIARPYLRMRAFEGMEWSAEDVARYATTLQSYAAAGTRLLGPITQAHVDPGRVQDTLFPGLVLLVLGVAGLAVAPRRYRAVALVGSAAAVLLSLGPETPLYRFLYEHVVLVRGIRALSRLSLLPVLALCVLAGLALARVRWPWALLALTLALVESSNAPVRYARYDGPSDAARWLSGQAGAVVVLPAGEDDTHAMLEGVAHWRPLVNGDSGFVPRPYTRALELLGGSDEEEALRFLRAVGVTHAVTREPRSWALLAESGGQRVYGLPAGPPADVVEPAPAAATLWRADSIVIDLLEPRAVDRLVFELDERPWIPEPALLASTDGRQWTRVAARASLAAATLSLYADPRHGRGEVRFAPITVRFLRLDPGVPARAVAFGAAGGRPLNEERLTGHP